MKNCGCAPLLVGLLSLTLTMATHAERPLTTDNAGVLDRGSCELEGVLSRVKTDGVRVDGSAVQLGCGVGAGTQVSLAADRAREPGLRVRGTNLAAKVLLLPGDDASWAASASLGWLAMPGERNHHAETTIVLLHTRALSKEVSLHANLGHAHDVQARRGATTWGVALEHAGWGPVTLVGELFGDDLAAPTWNIGLRWTVVPDRWVLDTAYGRQRVDGRPQTFSIGTKLNF